MSSEPDSTEFSLPLPALERIDGKCLEFEAAWKAGEAPRIEDYLGDTQGAERGELLRQLLLLDLDYRRLQADQPTEEEYRGRFSDDGEIVANAFNAFGEFSMGTASSPPPGTRVRYFGDYELLEEVGHGGMGVVYKARQVSLNRVVALKMILSVRLTSQAAVNRFRAEAETAANLQHPNIVAVHEVGVHNGQQYFSMDYVDGQNLAEMVHENPLPANRAAQYVRKIAEAIHYAHEQGTLHRDLKPSNVLIDTHDEPRVTDFGLAKRMESAHELTGSSEILGTPSYMAPEQAEGKHERIGVASDVYSLGAILYELLTGRPVFHAATPVETLRLVIDDEPVAPRRLNPGIDRDLETICLKCLEKDPSRRYGTADELADELRRYERDEPIRARPVSSFCRVGRWCRRNPLVATLAATVAISLIVGAVVSYCYAIQADARARDAVAQRVRADRKAEEAKANAAAAQREEELAVGNLYVAHMTIVQQHLDRQRIGRALSLLESYRTPDDGRDLRGFEWYHFWSRCQEGLQKTLREHDSVVTCVAYHPDGSLLASGGADGMVIIWNAVSLEPKEKIQLHHGSVSAIAFSPNGAFFASGASDGRVHLRDTRRGQWQCALQMRSSSILSLAFSPDSSRLVCSATDGKLHWLAMADNREISGPIEQTGSVYALTFSPDGEMLAAADQGRIRTWDLNTKTLRSTQRAHRLVVPALAFSPDGRMLASAGSDVRLWDITTGREKARFEERATSTARIAYSPDGQLLAWGCDDGTVKVCRTAMGEVWAVGHNESVTALAFSPDNSQVVSASADRTIKIWSVDRSVAASPIASGERIWSVVFSPDGRFAASAGDDRRLTLWDAAIGVVRHVFQRRDGPIVGIAFSPDNRLVACSGDDARVELWECESGEPSGELLGHEGPVYGLAFSPDGRLLASAGNDGTVRLWDVAGKKIRAVLGGHRTWVWSVAFAPDGGKLAAVENGGAIRIWDVAQARSIMTLPVCCKVNSNAVFLPDGKTIAVVSADGGISLWDTEAGIATASFSGDVEPRLLSRTADGRTLASCNDDGSVTLWDVKRQQLRATLWSKSDAAVAMAFSPDASILVTGSEKGQVLFWRAASEREVRAQTSLLDTRLELARRRHAHGRRLESYGHRDDAEKAYRGAAAVFAQVADEFPDSTEYRRDMATNCTHLAQLLIERADDRREDFQEAATWARQAVTLDPKGASGSFTLGVALYRSGNYAEALPALQKAAHDRSAFWGNEWFYIAMTQYQLGQLEESQIVYRRALGWLLAHARDGASAIKLCQESAEQLQVPPQLRFPPQRSERCADLPADLAWFMDFEPDTVLQGCCRTFVSDLSGERNYGVLEGACLVDESELRSSLVCRGGHLRLEKPLLVGQTEFTIAGWLCQQPGEGGLRLYSEHNRGIVFEIAAAPNGAIVSATWNKDRPDNWMHSQTPTDVFRPGELFFLALRFGGAVSDTTSAVITVNDRDFTVPAQTLTYEGQGYAEIGGNEQAAGFIDNIMVFHRAVSDTELQQMRRANGATERRSRKASACETVSSGGA